MRGFFAGAGPGRGTGAETVAPTWAALRAEARKTRWLWTLPVEAGYAGSLIEVQRDWSLDDVMLVVDRVEAKRREMERRAKR